MIPGEAPGARLGGREITSPDMISDQSDEKWIIKSQSRETLEILASKDKRAFFLGHPVEYDKNVTAADQIISLL